MAIPFKAASTSIALKSAPINSAWIIEGNPVARAAELTRSPDQTAYTVVWDCTKGTFDWTYHLDETIHILEGWITLSDAGNPPRRLGPGDVVFFPKGSQVRWEVESYVKKVAFFRRVVPNPLMIAFRTLRAVKRMVKRAPATEGAGLMGDGNPAAGTAPRILQS